MTHTPGPWGVSKNIEVWIKAGPIHVATIPRAGDGDWSPSNARLIAAAPDLLEACLAMIAWDDSENNGPDYGTLTRDTHPDGEAIWRTWWDKQYNLCDRAFSTAREAIAKAEGRE